MVNTLKVTEQFPVIIIPDQDEPLEIENIDTSEKLVEAHKGHGTKAKTRSHNA